MFRKTKHNKKLPILTYKSRLKKLNKTAFSFWTNQAHISKDLYNQALYEVKTAAKKGKSLSYPQLDEILKNKTNLEGKINYRLLTHAGVAQQTLIKLSHNISSFFELKKDYRQNPSKYKAAPHFPNYLPQKGYFSLIFTRSTFRIKEQSNEWCIYHNRKLVLKQSLPQALEGKRIQQIQLIYRYSHFEVIYMYEDDREYEKVEEKGHVMAIDLGINRPVTCVTNGVIPPFAFNGNPCKSKNQLYNKRMAKLRSHLDKQENCHYQQARAKGKPYGKRKWTRQMNEATQRLKRQREAEFHEISACIEKVCIKYNLSTVVIGDIHTSMNKPSKMGKKFNQKFRGVPLGKLVHKIKYKLAHHGIQVIVREESYTSQSSFIDGDELPIYGKFSKQERANLSFSGSRVKGGYHTDGGDLINADVNGAYNILRKEFPNFSSSDIPEMMSWYHPMMLEYYGGRIMTRTEKKAFLAENQAKRKTREANISIPETGFRGMMTSLIQIFG